MPEDSICHGTIFLVYQGNAQGHYDAALPSKQKDTITTLTDSVVMEIKCSCGKNSKEDVLSCVHRPLYASRCKCYKNGVPCSIMCKCKDCKNPHGQRLKASETSTRKKRHCHMLQVDLPCTKKFASDSGEDNAHGMWSSFKNTCGERDGGKFVLFKIHLRCQHCYKRL